MKILIDSIEKGIKEKCTPSVAYGIIDEDKISTGAVGSMTYDNLDNKVTADTLYDIASLSKVVVTVPLVSLLIERGEVKLSDSINKYLPRFKYEDVTIENLLTHTSGLPADFNDKNIIPRKVALDKVYNSNKECETGTKVIYSDLGYILLGEMISSIYHDDLDNIAREEIFKPLNMNSTCFCPANKEECAPTEVTPVRGLVQGIVHDEKACSLGGVAGHAGVFTNAKDLSNFVSMILNDGMFNRKRFLSKEIIDEWFKPMVHESHDDVDRYRSWCWITGKNNVLSSKDMKNTISFSGFTGPSIVIDHDKKLGIVLLDSRIHPSRNNPKFKAFRRSLNDGIYEELYKDVSFDYSDR